MAKFKKIIVAGPLVIETVYPAPNPRDSAAVRQGKKALSSEAQRRMNFKYAWQKLELEIAANFGSGDLFLTLTYDDAHLPPSREAAKLRIKAFIRKLRAYRKSLAEELRYIYNIEGAHGEGRLHHHVILNSTGEDYKAILALWDQGEPEFEKIVIDRDHTYEMLARYMVKEARIKVGHRLWTSSRNLRKPETDCFRVPNDTPLEPPKNVTVLEDSGNVTTAYGHYRYLKYMAAGWPSAPHTRAKRRRRPSRK